MLRIVCTLANISSVVLTLQIFRRSLKGAVGSATGKMIRGGLQACELGKPISNSFLIQF